jgi:CDP-diacylglycerol--serine O-phosphatidyltransferase
MADRRDEGPGAERGPQDKLRKAVFLVPSLFTVGNIFCGFYSVTESLAGAQALSLHDLATATEHFDRAAINIGFAYLFDGLDGRIARMTHASTEFGVELDSIADVVSFGIGPAILAFTWGYGMMPQLHKIAWAVSFLFLICGALRLARFNVQAHKPAPKLVSGNPKTDKKAFVGMPIPAGAALIAAIVHFTPMPISSRTGFSFSIAGQPIVLDSVVFGGAMIFLVAFLGFLMVSTIRYSSFKGMGARRYHPRVLFLGLTLVILAIWFYSRWTLLLLAVTYVSHGLLSKLWSVSRFFRRRKGGPGEQARLELDESRPPG